MKSQKIRKSTIYILLLLFVTLLQVGSLRAAELYLPLNDEDELEESKSKMWKVGQFSHMFELIFSAYQNSVGIGAGLNIPLKDNVKLILEPTLFRSTIPEVNKYLYVTFGGYGGVEYALWAKKKSIAFVSGKLGYMANIYDNALTDIKQSTLLTTRNEGVVFVAGLGVEMKKSMKLETQIIIAQVPTIGIVFSIDMTDIYKRK